MAQTYDVFDGDTGELMSANVTAEDMFPDDEDERGAFLRDMENEDGHVCVGGGASPLLMVRRHDHARTPSLRA